MMLTKKTQDWVNSLMATTDSIERLKWIGQLVDEGVSTSTIARESKLADYLVRHYARVHRKLVPDVIRLFGQGKISFSLARAIASLPATQQEKSARDSIAKKISVHSFRANAGGNADKQLVRDLERLADQYSELSGLHIIIMPDTHNPKAGSWVIRYESLDMFDTITEKLLGKAFREDY